MIRVAVVGLGKMGLSHLSMIRAHPEVDLVGICDATGYVLDVLAKYTGVPIFNDYLKMLDDHAEPDAVLIATPTHLHAPMVRAAMERGVHVFCEKPLCAGPRGRRRADHAGARTRHRDAGRLPQPFRRLVRRGASGCCDAGAIGTVTTCPRRGLRSGGPQARGHAPGAASGRRVGGASTTTRLTRSTCSPGTSAAAVGRRQPAHQHVLDGDRRRGRRRTLLSSRTPDGQLSVNWSDESQRKMTRRSPSGAPTAASTPTGRSCRSTCATRRPYPRATARAGTSRYTTELTEAPWFYLRGEEYSAQLDAFVRRVQAGEVEGLNDFASAAVTDRVIALIAADALPGATRRRPRPAPPTGRRRVDEEGRLAGRRPPAVGCSVSRTPDGGP